MGMADDGAAAVNDDVAASDAGEDVIEVGRGLANYNSAQILRIKGLNRLAPWALCCGPY